MYTEQLQTIFKRRFHGATNIKGIDFQVCYALYLALDLLSDNSTLEKITLEGIEDLDLKPFKADNVYFQVKTSVNPWHLYDLADPIINFIHLNDIAGSPQKFNLVVDFAPRVNFINLFATQIPTQEKEKLIKNIVKLKPIKDKKITQQQVVDVISNCEIKTINKEALIKEIKIKIHKILDIQPVEIEHFLLSFLYQFLNWSIERKTISKIDILEYRIRYSENKERSAEFEAYGKGLIDRVSWKKETNSSDYFEGKKTRSGHIALGLDVVRKKWLEKIDELFNKTKVCVIREASGQGKSTLAFRYAHDYWNQDYTFIIKVVETAQQAEQISNYLKCLSELGLAVTVLIDDVNTERRYFSTVLQNCANYEIPFLITSRNDDYKNFENMGRVSVEFIIPRFDRIEAKLIYQNLKKESRIHVNVISSDWAYEKINSPKCLIEFIFLITQGEMLHERLSQQVREMRMKNQGVKIDLLRKIIIADICKTPISTNQIAINDISSTDYQGVLEEMKDEFVLIEKGFIQGYHWVRSSHLLRILHENYTNPAITALKTIPLLENNKVSTFIGNLIEIPDLDPKLLIDNFKIINSRNDAELYLSFLSGMFKIGEYLFFLGNKEIYDEAYEKFNDGALFLFNTKHLPIKPISLFDVLGDNQNFKQVEALSDKIKAKVRGFDLVKAFAKINKFSSETKNLELIAKALDWSHWIKVNLVDANKIEELINKKELLDLEIKSFSLLSLSLFRIYPDKYYEWLEENQNRIREKLQYLLQCSISSDKESILITYTDINEGESFHDATMRRLNHIRSCFPFYKKYKGRCISEPLRPKFTIILGGHSFDESNKSIPEENFHFEIDIEKNKILNDIVDLHYRVKTWYEFLNCYYELRQDILLYSEKLCSRLKGITVNFKEKNPIYISEKILHSYKQLPIILEPIRKPFSDCLDVFNSFNNFIIMKSDFVREEYNEEAKRMLFINYNNFLIKLPKMHVFFAILKDYSPNYFPFEELNPKELRVFYHLKDLLKINIPYSQAYWDLDTNID